jgi:hypothetical protein
MKMSFRGHASCADNSGRYMDLDLGKVLKILRNRGKRHVFGGCTKKLAFASAQVLISVLQKDNVPVKFHKDFQKMKYLHGLVTTEIDLKKEGL